MFKIFVALQIADIATTYIGITHYGLKEMNSFAATLFDMYGIATTMIIMKIIGLIIIYYGLKFLSTNIKTIWLLIANIVMILFTINNIFWIMN